MAKPEPILEVDLGERGGKLIFRSHQEIQDFINSERNFWQWLQQPPLGGNQAAQHAWNVIHHQFQELQQAASNFSSNSNYEQHLRETFLKVFSNTIPISSGKTARFLSELKDFGEPTVASGAAAARLGHVPSFQGFTHFRGAVEMAAFEVGINPQAGKAAQKELSSLAARYDKIISETDKKTDALIDGVTEAVNEQQRQSAETIEYNKRFYEVISKWNRHKIKIHRRAGDEELKKAVKQFKETEDTYKEFMKLRGPVEYWTNKATTHAASARSRRNWLLGFAIPTTLLVVIVLVKIATNAPTYITKETPIFVIGIWGAIGVFLTTVVFWAARVMMRLYLSEHHLAIDAEERKTMAMTYLALTNEGKIDEKDRSLILAPLFRPTADGIVKDDAAPDIGLSSLLSKVASKP